MVDRLGPGEIKEAARRVLGLDRNPSDDEIQSAFREMSGKYHPDVSDEEGAEGMFTAINQARDVLLGNENLSDESVQATSTNVFSRALGEEEISEIESGSFSTQEFSSDPVQRTDPTGFDPSDFVGMGSEERSEVTREIYLGVETLLVWQGVSNLYEAGYDRQDFFQDLNDYIGEEDPESIEDVDYYHATLDGIRDEVDMEVYLNSISRLESNLQKQYGQGANVSEIAKIIANFMVQGGLTIGESGRIVGGSRLGNDPRFGRDERFGRDTRFGRDSRFARGPDGGGAANLGHDLDDNGE